MKQWYLVQSKPKQQLRAQEQLTNQGIESFMPTIELEKVIRGKRQIVIEPMFANYIFVCFEDGDIGLSKIRSTRGIRDFVRFGLELAKVPMALMEQLKIDVSEINPDKLEGEAPKFGDRVLITNGAFKDLEAVFQTQNGDERSFILLNVLNKTIKMDIANQDVIKITE